MTNTYAIYDEKSGRIVAHVTVSPGQLAAQIPAGHAAKLGRLDPRCQRIDPVTGNVVSYTPDPPGPGYELDDNGLWVESETARAKRHAQEHIVSLEARQARAQRELLIDLAGRFLADSPALAKLQEIDDEIRESRDRLSRE